MARPDAFLTLRLVLLLHLLARSVDAYNLLLNDTAGNYHNNHEITDGSGQVIGYMYQDSVFDPAGQFLGINQGYDFIFNNGTSFNYNNVMFLGEGQEIYWMDYAIIRATGNYKRYEGGILDLKILQSDPNFVAEITFYEPPAPAPLEEAESISSDSDSIKLRVTSKGGYYVPIISDGEQIGQQFQNPITMPDSESPEKVVGLNQGYSFLFPQDSFITDVLGYSSPEQVPLGNRRFILDGDRGGEMIVFNEQVLYATGSLRQYMGATLAEEVLSTDPMYVSDITLRTPSIPKISTEEEFISEGSYNFRITSDGGFWEAMLDESGSWIGERFQNPVYNSANVRIGTNEGYDFNFPATNYTPSVSDQALGNRKFYLKGGTLDILNEAIVAASGIYTKYSGGTFDETIISYTPFVSEIILVQPLKEELTDIGDAVGTDEKLDSTSNSAMVFTENMGLAGGVGFLLCLLM